MAFLRLDIMVSLCLKKGSSHFLVQQSRFFTSWPSPIIHYHVSYEIRWKTARCYLWSGLVWCGNSHINFCPGTTNDLLLEHALYFHLWPELLLRLCLECPQAPPSSSQADLKYPCRPADQNNSPLLRAVTAFSIFDLVLQMVAYVSIFPTSLQAFCL